MNKLNLMLSREIRKNWAQFAAAAAVVFAGITMFAASYLSYRNLKNSMDSFYEQYRFMDYYASGRGISSGTVKRIQALPGVMTACGRNSQDIAADMGETKRVTLRLVTLPENEQPEVNRLFFLSGRYSDLKADTCFIGQKFAAHYHLKRGGRLRVIINQRSYEFIIAGVVGSPEFVYELKSAASFLPTPEDFGIIYIADSRARSLLGLGATYNQVHVIFKKDHPKQATIAAIENLLKPGFITGTERKDQASHIMFEGEVNEYEEMAYLFPILFLGVAAIIIYVMQKRTINNQRILIGVMKAFGYSNGRILRHYLGFAGVIAIVGAFLGAVAGIYLGSVITSAYNGIFSLPVMRFIIDWRVLGLGIGLSLVFCLAASFNATRNLLKIEPAQAMRPETPQSGRRIFVERLKFWSGLSFSWKMSIRNVFRNRQRAILTILGTAFTIMLFIVSLFLLDSIDYILNQHFFEFQRQDYKIGFNKPVLCNEVLELAHIDGIRRVEPLLDVPGELRNGWRNSDTVVSGLLPQNFLYRLRDEAQRPVAIPSKGILVAQALADELGIEPGNRIVFKPYLGEGKERTVSVAGIVKQYAGSSCFMNLEELTRLINEDQAVNGALLQVTQSAVSAVKQELLKYPAVETVESRTSAYYSFLSMMELFYLIVGLMVIFGAVMGFAITFNTTVINITERRRELASLKVLGYAEAEIERTLFRETMLLSIAAIIPGIVLGRAVAELLSMTFSTDLFVLEVVIEPRTYLLALIGAYIFSMLALRANRRQITGLDMVEVLKNREA